MSDLTTRGLIADFLKPVREEMEQKSAAADNSVSHMDTDAAKPEQQAKQKPGSTEQQSLGKEQTEEAHNGSANADSADPNSEDKAKDFADTAGPQTLTTDDKVVDKGNIGPRREQAVTQEQKMARAERLAGGILTAIEKELQKSAKESCAPGAEGGDHGNEYVEGMEEEEDKEASYSPEEEAFMKIASVAQEAASEYYEGFLLGMLKRAQDEAELRQANLPEEVLQKVGGIEGLLDKVAMEDPAAVLPEEALAPAGPAPEAGGEELPPEAGVEGGDDLDALAAELEAAGITPEQLEAAMADVGALQEAGVSPEEITTALGEIGGEAPAEAPPMPAEGEMKEASLERQRIEHVKAFLTR